MKSSKRLAITLALATCALFSFTAVASAAAPANDAYASAVPLLNGVAATGTNVESTLETDETGIYSGYALNNSVWYTFTPQKTGTISFSSCSTFWINLIIVKGATLATSSPAATGPDSVAQSTNAACSGGTFTTNVAQFDVTAGVPLKIHLGSAIGGSTGTYSLTANYLPDITNDNFVDATELSDGVSVDGYNIDGHGTATEEASETPGGRGAGASKGVWYKINTVGSGKLNVSACAIAGFDGVIDVFTGSSVSSLSLLTWADGGSCDATSPLYFTASQEIYIRVSGYNGNTGGFVMNATFLEAAANDNFADAELVSGNNVNVNWDNANAGNEVGEPAPSNNGATLWYKWTPAADGFATFSTCPTVPFDTVVGVFTGVSVNALTTVASADGGCDNGGSSTAAIAVAGGTTYHVQVGGYFGNVGSSPLTIEYESVPANQTVATAQDLGNAVGVHILSDNRYADDAPEVGEPNFGATQRYKSVWFKWTAPISTEVTFDACGPTSGSDGYIAVFSNSAAPAAPTPANLVPLAGGSGNGDDNCTPTNAMGTQIRPVTAGQTYWIGIANYSSGAAGRDFNLNISTPATNTAAPTIDPGDLFVGNELSLDEGTWVGEGPITYTYQWDRCELNGGDCNGISGANDPTYTLTAGDKGYEIRVRVTGSGPGGANVAVSARSSAIDSDGDSDGVGDETDACPTDAQGAGKSNGCPIENVSVDTNPSVTGTAQVGSTLTLAIGTASNTPGLDSSVTAPTSTIYWYSCSSATIIGSCATRTGSTTSYSPVAGDVGRFIRAEVAWTNGDGSDSSAYSVATAAVAAAPVVTPPVDNTPPATPPAPTNPVTLAVKPKLGTLTPKKGRVTISAAVVTCAATATGPCAGTVTLSIKVKNKAKKFVMAKISVAPGKSAPVAVKFTGAQLKAIKKAKSLKFTAAFSVTGPGFAATTASGTGMLKPQK